MEMVSVMGWEDNDGAGVGGVDMGGMTSVGALAILLGKFLLVAVKLGSFSLLLFFLLLGTGISGAQK